MSALAPQSYPQFLCVTGAWLTLLAGADVLASAGAAADAVGADAAAVHLEFIEQHDGRCLNLSAGGKLRLLANSHPTRVIRYRLVRHFAGKPQAGRAAGIIGPRSEPVALGCSLVDGRDQRWELERAEFVAARRRQSTSNSAPRRLRRARWRRIRGMSSARASR